MKYVCDSSRHLVCVPYSIENLHAMADMLNIKRCWFHGGRFPHYDIPRRRMAEIEAKCVKVRSRVVLDIIKGEIICF